MDLQIKTEEALEIIKLGEMTQGEMLKYQTEHRKNYVALAKGIIGSYAGELITAAEEAGVELDLSYETIKNIPAALTMLYNKQFQWGYENLRNKIVTCRTFAAYITLLIINNFDRCSISVNRYSNNKNEPRPEMWADSMVLRFNNKKNSDILPDVWKGANMAPVEMDNGFTIDITPLVQGYMRLTGDNLADEGLGNIILTHE